jgi:hypothetical protein
MKPLSYFAVASQQVATHPVGVLKLEATLNASATAGLFLQLHDSSTVPADGAVPIKCWPAAECGYKEFKMGEIQLTAGLYACLSTTAATKTLAVGGSDKLDILAVELTDPETPSGMTVVGDKTSPVTGLQVWADSAGPFCLLNVEVGILLLGADSFLQIFATDSPAEGAVPLESLPIKSGEPYLPIKFNFGETGRNVFSIDANGNHDGCTLKVSSTGNILTTIASTVTLRAEYRP